MPPLLAHEISVADERTRGGLGRKGCNQEQERRQRRHHFQVTETSDSTILSYYHRFKDGFGMEPGSQRGLLETL
jgi:hypothetical protein